MELKNGHAIIVTLLTVVTSDKVFAQLVEPPMDMPWYGEILAKLLASFPEANGYFAAAMLFLMGLFRCISELFSFVASKTESTKDDEIAAKVAVVARWISSVVGWFGLGSPSGPAAKK